MLWPGARDRVRARNSRGGRRGSDSAAGVVITATASPVRSRWQQTGALRIVLAMAAAVPRDGLLGGELEHPARRRQGIASRGLGKRGDEGGDVEGAPMPVGRARVDRQDGATRVPEEGGEHERARGTPEPDRLRAEYSLGEGRRQLSKRGPSRQHGLRSRYAHPRLLSGHRLRVPSNPRHVKRTGSIYFAGSTRSSPRSRAAQLERPRCECLVWLATCPSAAGEALEGVVPLTDSPWAR